MIRVASYVLDHGRSVVSIKTGHGSAPLAGVEITGISADETGTARQFLHIGLRADFVLIPRPGYVLPRRRCVQSGNRTVHHTVDG